MFLLCLVANEPPSHEATVDITKDEHLAFKINHLHQKSDIVLNFQREDWKFESRKVQKFEMGIEEEPFVVDMMGGTSIRTDGDLGV